MPVYDRDPGATPVSQDIRFHPTINPLVLKETSMAFVMPLLETERLIIRPFVMDDLDDAYRLFDIELNADDLRVDKIESKSERAEWLQWSVLNYTQLAKLHQPPYGDRAIVLKSTGILIGSCGYVPCLNVFEQMPNFSYHDASGTSGHNTTEFGLFYAISPSYQQHGYATEAAGALVDYAFDQLNLKRIIATTDDGNLGSIGVMRKLGMQVEKNPLSEPPWLQVVGVLENNR
jgi:ribosomal-protein-alanine N-acetyltransferase